MATKVCERCGRLTACSVPNCPLANKKSMEQQGGQQDLMQVVSILYDEQGNPSGSPEAQQVAESMGIALDMLYEKFPNADAFMQYLSQMQGGGGEMGEEDTSSEPGEEAMSSAEDQMQMMKTGGMVKKKGGACGPMKKGAKVPPNKMYEVGGKIQKSWSWNF